MDRATDAILFEDTLLQLLHSEQLKSRLLFIHTLIQLSTIVHNKLLYAPFISIVIVRYPEGVWTHEGQRKNATITVSEYIDVLIPIRSLSLDNLLLYCGRYEGILAKIQRLLLIPQSCKQYDSGPTMHLHGFPRTSWNDHDLVLTFFSCLFHSDMVMLFDEMKNTDDEKEQKIFLSVYLCSLYLVLRLFVILFPYCLLSKFRPY